MSFPGEGVAQGEDHQVDQQLVPLPPPSPSVHGSGAGDGYQYVDDEPRGFLKNLGYLVGKVISPIGTPVRDFIWGHEAQVHVEWKAVNELGLPSDTYHETLTLSELTDRLSLNYAFTKIKTVAHEKSPIWWRAINFFRGESAECFNIDTRQRFIPTKKFYNAKGVESQIAIDNDEFLDWAATLYNHDVNNAYCTVKPRQLSIGDKFIKLITIENPEGLRSPFWWFVGKLITIGFGIACGLMTAGSAYGILTSLLNLSEVVAILGALVAFNYTTTMNISLLMVYTPKLVVTLVGRWFMEWNVLNWFMDPIRRSFKYTAGDVEELSKQYLTDQSREHKAKLWDRTLCVAANMPYSESSPGAEDGLVVDWAKTKSQMPTALFNADGSINELSPLLNSQEVTPAARQLALKYQAQVIEFVAKSVVLKKLRVELPEEYKIMHLINNELDLVAQQADTLALIKSFRQPGTVKTLREEALPHLRRYMSPGKISMITLSGLLSTTAGFMYGMITYVAATPLLTTLLGSAGNYFGIVGLAAQAPGLAFFFSSVLAIATVAMLFDNIRARVGLLDWRDVSAFLLVGSFVLPTITLIGYSLAIPEIYCLFGLCSAVTLSYAIIGRVALGHEFEAIKLSSVKKYFSAQYLIHGLVYSVVLTATIFGVVTMFMAGLGGTSAAVQKSFGWAKATADQFSLLMMWTFVVLIEGAFYARTAVNVTSDTLGKSTSGPVSSIPVMPEGFFAPFKVFQQYYRESSAPGKAALIVLGLLFSPFIIATNLAAFAVGLVLDYRTGNAAANGAINLKGTADSFGLPPSAPLVLAATVTGAANSFVAMHDIYKTLGQLPTAEETASVHMKDRITLEEALSHAETPLSEPPAPAAALVAGVDGQQVVAPGAALSIKKFGTHFAGAAPEITKFDPATSNYTPLVPFAMAAV